MASHYRIGRFYMKKNTGIAIPILLCLFWVMCLFIVPAYPLSATQKAWYWTGGVKKVLPGRSFTTARSIFVTGGDVYVSGSHATDEYGTKAVPCYWKNGVRRDLPCGPLKSARTMRDNEDLRFETDAAAIAVEGGAVYVAGHYSDDTRSVACLWKDGKRTDLPAGNGSSHASALLLHGGKAVIAGDYYNGTQTVACYWVDGVRTDLDSRIAGETRFGTGWGAKAASIFLKDGDLCAVGWHFSTIGKTSACYWHRGTRYDLPVPTTNDQSERRMNSRAIKAAMVRGEMMVLGATADETGALIRHEGCRWDNGGFHGTGLTFFDDMVVRDGRLYRIGKRFFPEKSGRVIFFAVDGRETQVLRDELISDPPMAIFVDGDRVYVVGNDCHVPAGGM
jgi:hypothetical protein